LISLEGLDDNLGLQLQNPAPQQAPQEAAASPPRGRRLVAELDVRQASGVIRLGKLEKCPFFLGVKCMMDFVLTGANHQKSQLNEVYEIVD
jgi:hypothetical protein